MKRQSKNTANQILISLPSEDQHHLNLTRNCAMEQSDWIKHGMSATLSWGFSARREIDLTGGV
jgi:hypothetical protein